MERDLSPARETQVVNSTGIVFNIQRFTIQDGPGIRSTVFFKGCPLRCLWCSNPESQETFPEVGHNNLLCNKCGRCVKVCDVQAITLSDNGVIIDRKNCSGCLKCVEACILQALKVYGKEMSVEEVFQEVLKDKSFYQGSGGGVTVSGGEPLLQADFVANLFQRCQNESIHTCLETCGYASSGSWERVLPYTNLILFDMKLINPAVHQEKTGKSNQNILNNLKFITGLGIPVIIRIPVIPGINDSKKDATETARYIAGFKGLLEVNLLPYHRFGESKYSMLDRQYSLSGLKPPESKALEELINIFESFNLNCEVVT
jgi:pyruvate formate lyase activating enzyme